MTDPDRWQTGVFQMRLPNCAVPSAVAERFTTTAANSQLQNDVQAGDGLVMYPVRIQGRQQSAGRELEGSSLCASWATPEICWKTGKSLLLDKMKPWVGGFSSLPTTSKQSFSNA